jgi:hypothetical protein
MPLGKILPNLPELLEIGLIVILGVLDAEGRISTGAGFAPGVLFLCLFIEREKTLERIITLPDERRIHPVPLELDEPTVEQALSEGPGKVSPAPGLIRGEILEIDGWYPVVF